MDRQSTQQGLGSTTQTAQAPAEPIRPPEVNRADDPAAKPADDRADQSKEQRPASRPHPGSPQTPR